MENYSKFINVKNDYYESSFTTLCEELEKGERVHIYVDCIGHTRAAWVEDDYARKLKAKYGDRLNIDGCSYNKAYYLTQA